MAKEKNNIHAKYEDGEWSVPCVRLKCIGFDEKLYAGLVAAKATFSERKRDMSRSTSPEAKRRRTG